MQERTTQQQRPVKRTTQSRKEREAATDLQACEHTGTTQKQGPARCRPVMTNKKRYQPYVRDRRTIDENTPHQGNWCRDYRLFRWKGQNKPNLMGLLYCLPFQSSGANYIPVGHTDQCENEDGKWRVLMLGACNTRGDRARSARPVKVNQHRPCANHIGRPSALPPGGVATAPCPLPPSAGRCAQTGATGCTNPNRLCGACPNSRCNAAGGTAKCHPQTLPTNGSSQQGGSIEVCHHSPISHLDSGGTTEVPFLPLRGKR